MNSFPAFKLSGAFCFSNWCDEKCMKLRELLYKMMDASGTETFTAGALNVRRFWYADQNYYFIKDSYNDFFYIATWYKGRGKTDCILFQGTPITEGQMDFLLATLRRALRGRHK